MLREDCNFRQASEDYIAKLVSTRTPKEMREILLISQFIIWREQCARLFSDQSKTMCELLEEIKTQWHLSARGDY